MFCKIQELKDGKVIKEYDNIGFHSNDYILRVTDASDNELFNSANINPLVKNKVDDAP